MKVNSYDQLQAALLDGHIDACGAFLASRRESDAGFAEYWYWLAQMHYRSSRFLQAADVCFKLTREASAFGMHFHCFADICAHLGVKDIGIAGLEMLASKPELGLASSYYVRLCGNHYLGEDEAVLELQRDASVPAACMSEHHRARSVMRRHGIAAGIDAFHRTYCSRQAVAELWPAQDLEHYWCGQRDLPKHLTIKGFSCGFGDFIQWSRYARVLRALGVAIAYDAQFDGLWDEGPIDDHARHLASQLKAADFVFGRNDTSMWTHAFALFSSLFPVLGYGEMGRYLAPGDDDRVEQIVRTIRQRAQGRQCIGIFWSSIESNNLYASRSLRLTHLTPLWDVSDDIHWVVMQRGHERMRWDNGPYAQDPRRCTNLPAATSLAQTLGIMDRLDGFVGNDGVLSHAAGALNKPGYLLLNARCADWRYEQYAGATPWYSSLQLLRPETMGGWDGLAATLASKIERGSAY